MSGCIVWLGRLNGNGYEFDEANTYWSKARKRHCRTCDRLRHRQYKAAKVAARG